MLQFLQRPDTDPYFNLAAEEYIFSTAVSDIFMTWRNDPSVIIGKHQNALKEINSTFIEKYKLPVIRRITGGGTVYHDPGNINFSFIFNGRKENLIDFRDFTMPVILFLKELGLNASFEGKNNITVNGLKVSGNSAHLHKYKILYHGTLLFDTDLEMLEKAIAGNEKLYTDKSVRSVRSKIINIKQLLNIPLDEFINQFSAFIFNYYGGKTDIDLKEEDRKAILKLVKEKYRSYAWNYGYSPEYEFRNKWSYLEDEYTARLIVKEGKIEFAEITGPEYLRSIFGKLSDHLKGTRHERGLVANKLISLSSEIDPSLLNQIADHLF